jgi:hypothetical protein
MAAIFLENFRLARAEVELLEGAARPADLNGHPLCLPKPKEQPAIMIRQTTASGAHILNLSHRSNARADRCAKGVSVALVPNEKQANPITGVGGGIPEQNGGAVVAANEHIHPAVVVVIAESHSSCHHPAREETAGLK